MTEIRLEIKYSTDDSNGGCVHCRAEQELFNCLRGLLNGEESDTELEQKYQLLVTFLQSSDLIKMRVESEKYLSEGKKVFLIIATPNGKPEFKLELS